jgi:hypothetical protein
MIQRRERHQITFLTFNEGKTLMITFKSGRFGTEVFLTDYPAWTPPARRSPGSVCWPGRG